MRDFRNSTSTNNMTGYVPVMLSDLCDRGLLPGEYVLTWGKFVVAIATEDIAAYNIGDGDRRVVRIGPSNADFLVRDYDHDTALEPGFYRIEVNTPAGVFYRLGFLTANGGEIRPIISINIGRGRIRIKGTIKISKKEI